MLREKGKLRQGNRLQTRQRALISNQIPPTLDLGLSSPQNYKNINFHCLSHAVCAILLRQPKLPRSSPGPYSERSLLYTRGTYSVVCRSAAPASSGSCSQIQIPEPCSGLPQIVSSLQQHPYVVPGMQMKM